MSLPTPTAQSRYHPFPFYLKSGQPQQHWWACYHSICVFRHFWWFPIFARPSAALYDSDNVVGCVSNHWQFTQCHSDHFRCLLAYIWLIATSMDYLCIPHTIVYLFDVFQTFSDFVSILFIFGDINIPMFQLFIVLADCTIIIGLDSNPYGLLVVSDPSDTISTSPRLFLLIFT